MTYTEIKPNCTLANQFLFERRIHFPTVDDAIAAITCSADITKENTELKHLITAIRNVLAITHTREVEPEIYEAARYHLFKDNHEDCQTLEQVEWEMIQDFSCQCDLK